MARAVGIDIGSKSLKILELETSGNQFQVKHFFNLEMPFCGDDPATLNLLIEPIRKIFRENRLEQNNIAISVPTQDCILREITLDFVQDEHIKKIIKYEAEKYLQSYPIEDVIIDFYKLQVISQNKSKVFFTAVPKKIISQRLDVLAACNLDPMTIDIDVMALIHLARMSPHVVGKETVVVVDFGASSTKLAVLHQGDLRYVRAIRVGASLNEGAKGMETVTEGDKSAELADIDWELEKQLIISLPAPEGLEIGRMVLIKKDHPDEVARDLATQEKEQDLFNRLIREIKRTMLNLDLESPIELICLTGGGSQMPGIIDRFQESFKIDTMLLGFPEKVRVGTEFAEEVETFGSIALGLAMEILDKNYKGMSFRRDEFKYTNRFELLKIPLATLVSLLFLLVLPWAYHFQSQRLKHQRDFKEQLVERSEAVWERHFQSEPLQASEFELISTVLERIDEEMNARSGGDLPQVEDGLTRWNAICKQFAEVRKSQYLTLSKFTLSPERALLEGSMTDPIVLDSLKRAMIAMGEVNPAGDKTGGRYAENPQPEDAPLKYTYTFDITFKREER